jgi:hypothetical protein
MTSFYLHLPSNSSSDFHSNNTTAHYITQLQDSVVLEGIWECALVEISFPHTFLNVTPFDNRITFHCCDTGTISEKDTKIVNTSREVAKTNLIQLKIDDKTSVPVVQPIVLKNIPIATADVKTNVKHHDKAIPVHSLGLTATIIDPIITPTSDTEYTGLVKRSVREVLDIERATLGIQSLHGFHRSPVPPPISECIVPHGFYKTNDLFMDAVNSALRVSERSQFALGHFEIDSRTGGARFKKTPGKEFSVSKIEMSDVLGRQLGYSPQVNIAEHPIAPWPMDLSWGLPRHLFVYTDIIEPQMIGDVLAPILRVVNTKHHEIQYGDEVTQIYTTPHYVPVMKRVFSSIEIDLRLHDGVRAPFQIGLSQVKLHFRPYKTSR